MAIWAGGSSNIGGLASLPNLAMVRAMGGNLPTGDNDIYTVPTGRKCYITGCRAYNPSGGTINLYHEIKVSGVYYRISSTAVTTTGTGSDGTLLAPIIINAGESIAVNCTTTAGLNVEYAAYEFDAAAPFTTYRILALANGDNTLYTCPAGKTASLGMQHMGFVISGVSRLSYLTLAICNGTGGGLNYVSYSVPSGGASGSTNQLHASTTINSISLAQFNLFATLTAGDFIVVNTSAGTAGQMAWVNAWEI